MGVASPWNPTVVGTGCFGLVTGACPAEFGNNIFCLDVDSHKIDILNGCDVAIYDSGLKEVIGRNVEAGRLTFSTDIVAGVAFGESSSSPLARRATKTAAPICSTCWQRRAASADTWTNSR